MSSTSQKTGISNAKREVIYNLDESYPLHTLVIFAKALYKVSDRIQNVRYISYFFKPEFYSTITIEYRVGTVVEDTEFFIKIGEAIRQVRINFEANG